MMPFFSVIIPLYNKEDHIKGTIKSVLNQEFKDFEVIIVNDGSTDESLKKIETLIDNRFKIINQDNQGVSHARNIGIAESKGSYIALLDADDFWYENHLSDLKKLIKRFPEAGLFCNNYEISYNNKLIKPATFNFEYNNYPMIIKDYFKSSIINSIAWTSSVAFTKESFIRIGKFNLKLRTGQDIDLWIRYALKYAIAFSPKISMRYHNFDINSLSKTEYNYERYNLVNNYAEEEETNNSLKKYLDINRYAIAIRCFLNNEKTLYKKLKKEIDYKNLNSKQRILLMLPKPILITIKWFQKILIDKKIYLTAYK
ncbi:glycosyltransferase family 2 protein [Flavivirga eckloniae]|nr:glycosyltransferase [Flavivirga eckloniae]